MSSFRTYRVVKKKGNPLLAAILKYFLEVINLSVYICDMIKRNESDVSHIVFEILAKTVFKFLCIILFLALANSS